MRRAQREPGPGGRTVDETRGEPDPGIGRVALGGVGVERLERLGPAPPDAGLLVEHTDPVALNPVRRGGEQHPPAVAGEDTPSVRDVGVVPEVRHTGAQL